MNALEHEITYSTITTKRGTKVMVATWTVKFKRDLIAQCADEQTVESEQIFFAGHSLTLSLEINSDFTAMGELQMEDSPQMHYLVLVFDSTHNIMHYWNQYLPKLERRNRSESDNNDSSRQSPINEPTINVPNSSFTLSQKSIEDGCLTLCCQLSSSRYHLNEQLKKLREEEFKDVTVIMTQDKKIGANRLMIASHSSVFHDWLENGDSVIRLPEFDSEVVDAMLTFIYSKRIPNVEMLAVDLLKMAEKYDIKSLRSQCETSLCEKVSIGNAIGLQALAEYHKLEKLKMETRKFIKDNIEGIQATSEWKEVTRKHWVMLEKKNSAFRKRIKLDPRCSD
nr:TD and POZ domain-containing protein 4-like [Aedes albopictus]